MNPIAELIESIQKGDAVSVSRLFDKIMASKLAESIEEKKKEIAESIFEEPQSISEAYSAKGTVTHGGETQQFKVKYTDFPSHADISKQNPHLKTHHVDAIMNHFEEHGDDDMTDTESSHGAHGTEVHVKHNTGSMDESFEQLDELSKQTLGRYIMRNHEKSMELTRHKSDNDDAQSKAMSLDYGSNREASKHMAPVRDALHKEGKKIANKISKRQFGMYRATRNLTKEEVEEFLQSEEFQALDELSKETLGKYVKKAASDMAVTHAKKIRKDAESDEVERFTNRHMNDKYSNTDKIKSMVGASQKERDELHRKTMKRHSGIDNAVRRLAK